MRSFNFVTLLCAISLGLLTPVTAIATPAPQHEQRAAGGTVSLRSLPKMVVYTDQWLGGATGLPTAAQVKNFNVLILSFLLVSGPADQVVAYTQMSDNDRASYKKTLNSQGCTLMLSAFGSTDTPTTQGVDAWGIGTNHANFVKQYGIQGIDVDYEDMTAMNKQDGSAEKWLIDYTTALRQGLPAGQYLITHAPVAPWFSPVYKSGAYITVHQQAGGMIDWYNMQFYNQGDTEYTTCNGLLWTSSQDFPKSSVFEIHNNVGVPLQKIVVGKPGGDGNFYAANGYVDPSTLSQCIAQAGKSGWTGGMMFWELASDLNAQTLISPLVSALELLVNGASLLNYGGLGSTAGGGDGPVSVSVQAPASSTIKVSASAPTPSSTNVAPKPSSTTSVTAPKPSQSPATTDPSSGSSCSGVDAWNSTMTYDKGTAVSGSGFSVSYNGFKWTNKWWTLGDAPGSGGDADPWAQGPACGGGSRRALSALAKEEIVRNVANARRMSRHKAVQRHM